MVSFKPKVESRTVIIWSAAIVLFLLFMAFATIGVIDSSLVNYKVSVGVTLLLIGVTIFSEEVTKKKDLRFKFKDRSKYYSIFIALFSVVFGILVLANILNPFEAEWLFFVIYSLGIFAVLFSLWN